MYDFAVIFDMDGVIADTNPYHKIALNKFCNDHGYNLTESQLREKIYGRTNKDWISNLFDGSLTPEQIVAYTEEKEALFREIYKEAVAPLAGLVNFLNLLDIHDISRAIATSAPAGNVEFILQGTHTSKYFTTILDDRFVEKGKPDPEIYLKTAKALNFAPEKCVVFEDSHSGVAAAQAANTKVVGVTTTHVREELAHCDLVIADFTEIDMHEINSLFNI